MSFEAKIKLNCLTWHVYLEGNLSENGSRPGYRILSWNGGGGGGGMVVSKKESSRPISSSLQLSQFGLSPPFDF